MILHLQKDRVTGLHALRHTMHFDSTVCKSCTRYRNHCTSKFLPTQKSTSIAKKTMLQQLHNWFAPELLLSNAEALTARKKREFRKYHLMIETEKIKKASSARPTTPTQQASPTNRETSPKHQQRNSISEPSENNSNKPLDYQYVIGSVYNSPRCVSLSHKDENSKQFIRRSNHAKRHFGEKIKLEENETMIERQLEARRASIVSLRPDSQQQKRPTTTSRKKEQEQQQSAATTALITFRAPLVEKQNKHPKQQQHAGVFVKARRLPMTIKKQQQSNKPTNHEDHKLWMQELSHFDPTYLTNIKDKLPSDLQPSVESVAHSKQALRNNYVHFIPTVAKQTTPYRHYTNMRLSLQRMQEEQIEQYAQHKYKMALQKQMDKLFE